MTLPKKNQVECKFYSVTSCGTLQRLDSTSSDPQSPLGLPCHPLEITDPNTANICKHAQSLGLPELPLVAIDI